MPVFDTPHGRIGAVICWENYMPLMRAAMYAKGIEIWCAPTLDGRDVWIASMRHVAVEGRCFVLSCNQFGRRSDYPAEHESEAILTAEIDRGAIARGKYDFDATGHYARPDVFRLIVDERRKTPGVTLIDEEPSRSARELSEVAG